MSVMTRNAKDGANYREVERRSEAAKGLLLLTLVLGTGLTIFYVLASIYSDEIW